MTAWNIRHVLQRSLSGHLSDDGVYGNPRMMLRRAS